jgi:hypothetical protein
MAFLTALDDWELLLAVGMLGAVVGVAPWALAEWINKRRGVK